MYKTLNIGAAATRSIIGENLVARVRKTDEGETQIRFTNRSNLTNLPKGEILRSISVKGSGRRVGFPVEVSEMIPAAGTKLNLVAGKYGWFTLVPAIDGSAADASVGA